MNKKERFFKVMYGFKVADHVSIGEDELEKAIYAQVKGVPVQLGDVYVNGRNIISITPHYHRHTGWYDYYEPTTGEDWAQIKRECPSYDGVMELYKQRVQYLIQNGREREIGKSVSIPELENLK